MYIVYICVAVKTLYYLKNKLNAYFSFAFNYVDSNKKNNYEFLFKIKNFEIDSNFSNEFLSINC